MSTAVANLPTYVQEKVGHAQLPAEYKAAVKAIRACDSIDIVKHYSDKADALAVMAKIYKDKGLETEAKRLKLHTFRKMGQLAEKLALSDSKSGYSGIYWKGGKWVAQISAEGKTNMLYRGDDKQEAIRCRQSAEIKYGVDATVRGSCTKLQESGLTGEDVRSAAYLAKMPKKVFNKAVNMPAPSTPGIVRQKDRSCSNAWKKISFGSGLIGMRSFCNCNNPKDLARELTMSEAVKAKELAIEITEWLDTFDQYLPQDVE